MFGINPAYRPNKKGFYETEIELPMDCLEKWKKNNEQSHLDPWFHKIKIILLVMHIMDDTLQDLAISLEKRSIEKLG